MLPTNTLQTSSNIRALHVICGNRKYNCSFHSYILIFFSLPQKSKERNVMVCPARCNDNGWPCIVYECTRGACVYLAGRVDV